MSRKLAATICLSMALIAADQTASAAMELGDLVIPGGPVADDGVGLPAPQGGQFGVYRRLAANGGYAGGVLDLDIHDDVIGLSAPGGYPAGPAAGREAGFTLSLNGGVGVEAGLISAGPIAGLRYTRSPDDGDGDAGSGAADMNGESLIGMVGLQALARFNSGAGPISSRLDLSLEQDFGGGTTAARNIAIEEIDATRFRLERAISLRIKGNVRGLFDYETRLRIRRTGIREVTARIKIDF